MITVGGEFHFISKMIDESCLLGKRIKFYTCLVGRKSDLIDLQGVLEFKVGYVNYRKLDIDILRLILVGPLDGFYVGICNG
jgi:23S rRNA A1618 N6-methylase RlmF